MTVTHTRYRTNAETAFARTGKPHGRLLRMEELANHRDETGAMVRGETGLSRTTIYRRIKSGSFPAPYTLGPNSIAWFESDIEQWKEGLLGRS